MNTIIATSNINLAGSWSSAWSSLSGPLGGFTNFLGIIGMFLVVMSIVVYIWERRKGNGNHTKLIWTLAVGAVLASPNFVLPAILGILDFIVNAAASLLHHQANVGGGGGGGSSSGTSAG